jgi:hypothetical protein
LQSLTIIGWPEIIREAMTRMPDYVAPETFSEPMPVTCISPADKTGLIANARQADLILVADENSLPKGLASIWLRPRLINVDRHAQDYDGWRWVGLGHRVTAYEGLADPERAQALFADRVRSLPHYDKAYIFGTGPSLDQALDFDFSDGYRVVCNTIVRNARLLRHIKPHFIVAADAIYHFGNNRHAYQFRVDLEQALEQTDACFLTADFFVYILRYHHPRAFARTISVRTDVPGIHLDMKDTLAYTSRPNILNGMLLPLGSSLAPAIYLLGFDGRAPGDKMFWTNSGENSYDDLKPTIQAAHPGFFAGRDYEEYARRQSESAEEIMSLGESRGRSYYCLNLTHIPALHKRLDPSLVRHVNKEAGLTSGAR